MYSSYIDNEPENTMTILTIIGLLYLIGLGWIADACRRAPFLEGHP